MGHAAKCVCARACVRVCACESVCAPFAPNQFIPMDLTGEERTKAKLPRHRDGGDNSTVMQRCVGEALRGTPVRLVVAGVL